MNISKKSLINIRRQKKNIFVWIGLAIIVIAFFMAMYNGIDMKAAIKANQLKNKQLSDPGLENDANRSANTKIAWAIDIENTIDGMEAKQESLINRMVDDTKNEIIRSNEIILKEIARSNSLLKAKLETLRGSNAELQNQINSLKDRTDIDMEILRKNLSSTVTTSAIEENGVLLPPPPLFSKIETVKKQIRKTIKKVKSSDPYSMFDSISGSDSNDEVKQEFEILSYKNTFKELNNSINSDELTEEELLKKNTYEILTGFSEAYMLTGAYVPLFGGSSSGGGGAPQSVPVLMETTGDLLMPNNTIGSIDKCFILGVSEGNAGARAVEIRLDKMTCIVDGGKKVLQGTLDGYVVSETGSPGLPATLIYKAGDFISRMIGAGILEGLSTAIVSYASSQGNNGVGGTNVYGGAMTGAGTGVNNAFSKLSEFYLQLAEATLPILEVKPGRFISIVVIGGNKFELKDVNLLDVRDVDSYINDFIGEE